MIQSKPLEQAHSLSIPGKGLGQVHSLGIPGKGLEQAHSLGIPGKGLEWVHSLGIPGKGLEQVHPLIYIGHIYSPYTVQLIICGHMVDMAHTISLCNSFHQDLTPDSIVYEYIITDYHTVECSQTCG